MTTDNKPQDSFDAQLIVPHVYLGSSFAAHAKNVLKEKNITHILSVQDGYKPAYPEDFTYMVVLAHDVESQNLLSALPYCVDFISAALNEGGNILVHCGAGVSRSATIMIAYVMHSMTLSYEKSLDLVLDARPYVCPNRGFEYQLKLLEEIEYNLEHIKGKDPKFVEKMGFFCTSVSVVQYTGNTKTQIFLQ
eukprot:Phypoly_transcript_15002.p1 GENE.Phypoly_transcript_15002~~Phypoly_transcript_15002.p1  ORF type:complete len:192 (+),score=23.10 Phypoly_transcript_15002:170-745(+)